MENDTYDKNLSHFERELELKGFEAADELQINIVTQQATQQSPEKPEPTYHQCKKTGHYQNQCHRREKSQAQNKTKSVGKKTNNNNCGQTNSNSNNKISSKTNAKHTNNQKGRKPRPVYPPCETCGKANHSTENCYFGANAVKRLPPGTNNQKNKIRFNKIMPTLVQM